MARRSRPDTLYSELAELRRRLRLLEAASARDGTAAGAEGVSGAGRSPAGPATSHRTGRAAGGAVPVLMPARPQDWWSCDSTDWEPIATASCPLGPYGLAVRLWNAPGDGAIRIVVAGMPVAELDVGQDGQRQTLTVPVPAPASDDEVELELRIDARGRVRFIAVL